MPTTAKGSRHPPNTTQERDERHPHGRTDARGTDEPAHRLAAPCRWEDVRNGREAIGRHHRRTHAGEEAQGQQGAVVPRQERAEHPHRHEHQPDEQHPPLPVGIGDRAGEGSRDPPRDGGCRGQVPDASDRGLERVRQGHQEWPQHQDGQRHEKARDAEEDEQHPGGCLQ